MTEYAHFKLIFVCLLIPIVFLVFPSPYFNVAYDIENDYLANTLSVYLNNYPVDYLHPGITITYLSSLFIKLFGGFNSPESLILFLRLTFMYVNLAIVCLSLILINKSKVEHVFLFIALLFFHPTGHFTIDLLSPNIILASLAVLVAILGIKLNNTNHKHSLFYGVVLAFGVATKLTFILLLLPVIASSLIGIFGFKNASLKLPKLLIIFASFSITILILFYPILPMMPFYLSLWGDLFIGLKSFLTNLVIKDIIYYVFLLIIVIALIFIAIKIIFKEKNNYLYEDIYKKTSFIIVACIFFELIINAFIGMSYYEIAISQPGRYLFPLIGFVAIFLTPNFSLFKFIKSKNILFIILLVAVFFKGYSNYKSYQIAKPIDSNFSLSIKKLIENDNNIVFYPSPEFTSKDYFLLWADYRYGDRISTFNEQSNFLPFIIDGKFKRLHILNSRSFNLSENLSEKFSYNYMNLLLSKDYISNIQKGLLSQHLYLLNKKDPCTEPFDNFSKGDSFLVIIPDNLTYLNSGGYAASQTETFGIDNESEINNNTIGLKIQAIVDDLSNYWSDNCAYKVSYSISDFGSKKSVFLEVLTQSNE